MKKIIFSRLLSSCMVLGLLLSHIPLAAIANSNKDLSAEENTFRYIYLGKELSNLSQIVDQATLLDENEDSLLHAMKKYMDNGSLIAGYEEVIEALEYAQLVIENNIHRAYRDTTKGQLLLEVTELIEQIMDGALSVDLDSLERGSRPKDCCPLFSPNKQENDCQGIVDGCRVVSINKELQVCGNASFKGDVKIKHDLHVGGELKVKDDAVFKEDVKIKGSLTAADAYISILDTTTLSADNAVIDNLTVTDLVVVDCMENLCVNNLSVNDLTVASCMDSLCVQNFSAVDAVINNLSVTDLAVISCMDSLCVQNFSSVDAVIDNLIITSTVLDAVIGNLTVTGTLSANDAIIQNATITDLVVLSCMDSLCVNDLSVVDISISGTLSVNDIIIDDATVSSFSATDAVISNSLTVSSLTPAGVVHNSALGLLSSSLIVNADVDAAAGIVDTKLATISTAGKVANSATTATSANTPNTIVLRDGSGNFAAGTITAALSGNATTATTAVNFSGALAGEVTGTQGATVVSNAVSANTANAIVRRTAAGDFSAGAISLIDGVVSSSLTVTPFATAGVVHNNASGLLSSSLIVNTDVDAAAGIVDTKLATISTAGKVANSATTATSANTANAIVLRDGSGNFSAGTITAALNGNATTATTAVNFSGALAGEVTGTQGATVVSNAVSANTASAIVRRTATGGFSAGAVSLTDGIISTTLTVTPFSTAGVVHNNASGVLSTSLIVNADVAAGAGIVDTKLATISTAGKVANSATTATSANTANAIVARDGTGSFATQIISIVDAVSTGNLVFTGATSTSTTGNVTKGGSRFIHNFATNNTFVGINAGNFTMSGTGGNTGIGENALAVNTTGETCTAVGYNALAAHTTGTSNVAIGAYALNATTSSDYNIGIGSNALLLNTTGESNVCIGDASLSANTIGSRNVALGKDALKNATSNDNIALGYAAGISLTTGSNNIYLGTNAGVATEANTTRIGTSQTKCFVAGIRGVTTVNANAVAVLIDSLGQLGTTSSTRRVKHDIADMGDASNDILNLRPVTFVYNGDESNTTQYGLIAEEVDQVFPAIVVCDKDGQPETVQYHILPVLLLNEMKKQQAVNARQDEAIAHLNITVEAMQMAINELQSKLAKHVN